MDYSSLNNWDVSVLQILSFMLNPLGSSTGYQKLRAQPDNPVSTTYTGPHCSYWVRVLVLHPSHFLPLRRPDLSLERARRLALMYLIWLCCIIISVITSLPARVSNVQSQQQLSHRVVGKTYRKNIMRGVEEWAGHSRRSASGGGSLVTWL